MKGCCRGREGPPCSRDFHVRACSVRCEGRYGCTDQARVHIMLTYAGNRQRPSVTPEHAGIHRSQRRLELSKPSGHSDEEPAPAIRQPYLACLK